MSATSHSYRKRPHLLNRRSLLNVTWIAPFSSLPYPAVSHDLPSSAPVAVRTHRFALAFNYCPARKNGNTALRQVEVPVEIQYPPAMGEEVPVVIFSSGFLQSPSSYGTFLTTLLTEGFIVVTYDKSFETLSVLVDDVDSVQLLLRVMAEAEARLRVDSRVGPFFLAGHSRGAKLSVLAVAPGLGDTTAAARGGFRSETSAVAKVTTLEAVARSAEQQSEVQQQQSPPPQQQLSRVSGIILLDPADGSFEPQDPGRYPSALSALRNQPSLAELPMLLVGAGRGGDCVPQINNYGAFFQACLGPCVLVTLKDIGHLQFLDRSDSLLQSICAAGRGVSNASVAAVSATLASEFIRNVIAATSSTLKQLYQERLLGEGLRYEVQFSGGLERS